MSTGETENRNIQPPEAGPQLHDLFSFSAGERTFAVFAEDVEGTADSKRPAPLPRAPASILGVVCVRGRMLTVVDPVSVITGEPPKWPVDSAAIIALRGDEQLALAADSFGDTITIAAADIQPFDGSDQLPNTIVGISRHGGEEITILNIANLFAAALQRKERRRRRF